MNLDALRVVSEDTEIPPRDILKLAFEQNIIIGDPSQDPYVIGEPKIGVAEVGTGVGTQTMDLVNLYQKLSGKTFDISIEEAGDHEPKEMISKRVVPHVSLEDGLLKTIGQ